MRKIDLDSVIPYESKIINVFGEHQPLWYEKIVTGEYDEDITFREVLTQAGFNFKHRGTAYIIVQSLMDGKVYQIGNYEKNELWEIGNLEGCA